MIFDGYEQVDLEVGDLVEVSAAVPDLYKDVGYDLFSGFAGGDVLHREVQQAFVVMAEQGRKCLFIAVFSDLLLPVTDVFIVDHSQLPVP